MFALTVPFPWLTKTDEDEAGVLDSGLTASVPTAASSLEIVAERLHHQHLSKPERKTPAQVVSWLGAMQAQDFPAATWAIGLRSGCNCADVEQAFNDGAILRTHVLRPTWHFVTPADIRWILALTAPRVHATNAYYYKQSGLDAKTIARACAMMHRVLDDGEPMTRAELAVVLKKARVPAEGLKLAYIMMHAELEGMICSGPRRGKQFTTYMLLDQRAPAAKPLDRRDALAKLAKRYFTSHGPATIRDYTWWSGLTVKDAELGIEAVKPKLEKDVIDGRTYWGTPAADRRITRGGAFLLPNYDEYLIAYKDRAPVVDAGKAANVVARSGGAYPHHLIIDGRLAGSWTREQKGNSVEVQVAPYIKLTAAQSRAVASAAECYGEFLGLPATLVLA